LYLLSITRFTLLLALLFVLNACSPPAHIVVSDRSIKLQQARVITVRLPRFYIVRKGDTLFSIAWNTGLDYQTLAKWNGLRKPWKIYQGQRLRLRVPVRSAQKPAGRDKTQIHHKRSASIPNKSYSANSKYRVTKRIRNWVWPAKGRIIERFNPGKGHKGITIKGQLGSVVRAAATGKVVYAGHGLRGYGNLIIIKHNQRYLSAYAHNQSLLVKEGQKIRKGQKIARMGSSGSDRTQLHFEVRRHGKPVDPLRLLPRHR